ncbi:response regulator transcription factor [bacterium]|nr:response regulator transcription factor [bacterium]
MNKKVIIIEDQKDINDAVKEALVKDGFAVTQVFDGINAMQAILAQKPDLILLDIMLPNVSGIEIIKNLKKLDFAKTIPVVFMTAKSDEIDQVVGYELGAIDYVIKPFSMRILTQKVKALLDVFESPKATSDEKEIQIGNIYINPEEFRVIVDDEEIPMTLKEFKLLQILASQRNKVFTREELLAKVWHVESALLETRTVDTHIKKIRQKLKSAAHYIKTIHGLGYKLSDQN